MFVEMYLEEIVSYSFVLISANSFGNILTVQDIYSFADNRKVLYIRIFLYFSFYPDFIPLLLLLVLIQL